jgi:hypothetical protein
MFRSTLNMVRFGHLIMLLSSNFRAGNPIVYLVKKQKHQLQEN